MTLFIQGSIKADDISGELSKDCKDIGKPITPLLHPHLLTIHMQTKKPTKKSMQDTPQFFVTLLRDPPKKEVLSSLRVRLGALPVKWLQEFISLNGVPLLLESLDKIETYVMTLRGAETKYMSSINFIMQKH